MSLYVCLQAMSLDFREISTCDINTVKMNLEILGYSYHELSSSVGGHV